ncbi:MARVEL domain-containing protein 2-like [Chanos chanos]|uniref:MARVEL domain-containing protein 2-like n=1 Tax=Chanos chanos TaxID=29144 RepID=A0A6J2VHR8_CHACN|nr:MARVEL domain-containing protein 2-like [Chanos chanos]
MKGWNKKASREEAYDDDGISSRSGDLNTDHSQRHSLESQGNDDPGNLNDCVYLSSSTPAKANDSEEDEEEQPLRKKTLLPTSWRSMFKKWQRRSDSNSPPPSSGIKILPNGTRVSPPVSPLLNRRYLDSHDSLKSDRPLFNTGSYDVLEGSELTSIHPTEYYAEKVEVYKLKYSYLKSWPGLLRLLAGLQLLFGGMVFACVCAYIQKDSEWSNLYNYQFGGYDTSGYYYNGPMTPFVLAVIGLAWIVTVILLVLGMTMYYRTILLDSQWWPVTEAIMNLVMFLLYMSAGIVYINDLNRGGLCYMTIGFSPIMSRLCRVDGGQMAGTAFIFINTVMYLVSFLVCLRMWRHEAARRAREVLESQAPPPPPAIGMAPIKSKKIAFRDEQDHQPIREHKLTSKSEAAEGPVTLTGAIPTGHIPKPRVIPDYVLKYPEIYSVEDREQYKAVFNDQYQEYKELHKDISDTLKKFYELEVMMNKLLKDVNNPEEKKRINQMLKQYEKKKNDPTFLERKERCEYLKGKLSHIKMRIRNFDQSNQAKG